MTTLLAYALLLGVIVGVAISAAVVWARSKPIEQLHASAPVGYKCADCTMDKHPCAVCYAAWWKRQHPEHHSI